MGQLLMCSIGILSAVTALVLSSRQDGREAVAERVQALTRDSSWTLVASIPMRFPTHHPQGMVKVGDTIFVSSVEVKIPTRRLPTRVDGYDRDTGEDEGHLFKVDMAGELLAHVRLGESTVYHPGGIDYDGRHIWVPVAEYRPNSRSIVYRVDPRTMAATEVFRFGDHLGAIVRNTDDETLHGVSWGSRRFYRWRMARDGTVRDADVPPPSLRTPNPSHYVDYQDCQYAGRGRMLCAGIAGIRQAGSGRALTLGGFDLVDLRDGRPLHQVPVPLWTDGGLAMTRNPIWLEAGTHALRAYFMPEDDNSTLYVYEAATDAAEP